MIHNLTSKNLHQELEILPFTVEDIPGKNWIVFAPHFDDETIGMGGTLLLAREKNVNLTLVFMTDGSQSGVDANIRKDEAKKVAEQLKVDKLITLDYPDRSMAMNETTIEEISKILEEVEDATVFIPSAMELHPDHRLTTQLVWEGLQQVHKKFHIYAYEISLQNQINTLVDISSVIEEKKGLMALYESQLEQNNYSELMVALNRLRTYTLPEHIKYAEGFYYYGENSQIDYKQVLSTELERFTQNSLHNNSELILTDFIKEKNSNQPLVSIIMPCFNDGEYIQEALNSIYLQSYSNLEIIVIDDCSTDYVTKQKLEEIKEYNLTLLSLDENCGPAIARNKAIETAKGKYILPLDADDKIAPNYIEKAVKVLEKNPKIGIVYCNGEYFGEEKGKWVLGEYNFEHMLFNNLIFISALFKKEDWEKTDGFNENLSGWEDYDFWLSLLELNLDVYKLEETLFFYRIKKESRNKKTMNSETKLQLHKQIFKNHSKLYIDNIEVLFKYLNHFREVEQLQISHISRLESAYERREREYQVEQQEMEKRFQTLQNRVDRSQQELEALLNSKSWKLTSPLRKLIKLLKTFLGKR